LVYSVIILSVGNNFTKPVEVVMKITNSSYPRCTADRNCKTMTRCVISVKQWQDVIISISVNNSFTPTQPSKNVTGSAKTGHTRTSLNLQYKALNTLGAYLRIVKKFCKFFEHFFLSERRV